MARVKRARKWILPLCCAAIWGIFQIKDAWAQARPLYEEKTIRIVDYGTAGGGSDLPARLVARHLPKYTPGTPQVVQNMPGAAGAIAGNYICSMAKSDGLTVGLIAGGSSLSEDRPSFRPSVQHTLPIRQLQTMDSKFQTLNLKNSADNRHSRPSESAGCGPD